MLALCQILPCQLLQENKPPLQGRQVPTCQTVCECVLIVLLLSHKD